MNILEAVILSVIEGLTEFLPVSSTGHLILTAHILKIPQSEFVKSFEIIIQLGAILSVITLYWKTLLHKPAVWKPVLAAFFPTAVVGFALYPFIKQILIGNALITLTALFIGGIILILFETHHRKKHQHIESIEIIPMKKAFAIGLFQSLSIVPGVSRSAASIIGGLLVGYDRKTAVLFSFLLAIPTMCAAVGYDILKTNFSFSPDEFFLLGIGFTVSYVVGFASIKYFLRYIERHSFMVFGMYRILLSIIYWFIFH